MSRVAVVVLAVVSLVLGGCGSPGSERSEEGPFDPLARNYGSELERAEAVVRVWLSDSWYTDYEWTADDQAFFDEIKRNDELYDAFTHLARESDNETLIGVSYFIGKSGRTDALDFLLDLTRSPDAEIARIGFFAISFHPSVTQDVKARQIVIARIAEVLATAPHPMDEGKSLRIRSAARLAHTINAADLAMEIDAQTKSGAFDEETEAELLKISAALRELGN